MADGRRSEDSVLRIVDGLGHDLTTLTADAVAALIRWLDLEELGGDLSPGLAELRDLLRAQEAEDV